MPFPYARPPKGSEIVMKHLKQQIIEGIYPPGSRLPTVVELSAAFEVGRSTIREALSALKATGWIDIRHGGGTFVSAALPSEDHSASIAFFNKADSLQEIIEVRKFIEAGCAALAAVRRTEEDLAALEGTLQFMTTALEDEAASEQADITFHLQIAAASHNTLLIQMMDSMTHKLQETMKGTRRLWFFSEKGSAEQLLLEHTMIYEAIRDRNEPMASSRIMEHILKVDRVLQRMPSWR